MRRNIGPAAAGPAATALKAQHLNVLKQKTTAIYDHDKKSDTTQARLLPSIKMIKITEIHLPCALRKIYRVNILFIS